MKRGEKMKQDYTKGNIWLSVKQMMNSDYRVIHSGDSLRRVIEIYKETKLDSVPVVDDKGVLLGVMPRSRLYQALLDGVSIDEPCTPYMVSPAFSVDSDLGYDEVSLIVRVNKSTIGTVPVVDKQGKVIGMAGRVEYMKAGFHVVTTTSALLESIFEAMHEGIIATDNEGCIIRINHSIEKMFGISAEEVVGLHLEEVFPGIDHSNDFKLGVKNTLRGIPVIINQVPIMRDDKQIGTNFVLLDISDIENIAQELESVKELQTTLSGVLSASSDGVFVSDRSGRIKYVNEMAVKLIGSRVEKMIGQSIEDILNTKVPIEVARSGIAEVDVHKIGNRNCVVSHVPIKAGHQAAGKTAGTVSIVYLADNKLTEEITKKWFSLQQQVEYYRDELEKQAGSPKVTFDSIVTQNPHFIAMKKEGQRIAQSSSTVLLTGESGVGKDMFARAIHAASPRANKPFIKVNCAAIPETLLESELFGYAPGSFTGAAKRGKPGYFEQAHEGTIFLDEIGDMPLSIQVKILQVLQEKQFMLVGGTKTHTVDVRIIAATNRNLREAMSRGEFREDLYYRLNVIEFYLPPLRMRQEDILLLAHMFIEKYNSILNTRVTGIGKEAQDVLQHYSWAGNIRELENAIERAANYVWEGEIELEHLPGHILQVKDELKTNSSYRAVLDDMDREIIIDTLRKTEGNKSAAARMLNISRSAFYEKLAKYGIK
jgi:transcriptional regulator with PAS, ATPase and Fis domain